MRRKVDSQSSSSLSITSRRFFSVCTNFTFPWKIWKVQPLMEPMLAPAKTGAAEDSSGSTLDFIMEFTAVLVKAFSLEEHEAIWRSWTLETVDSSLPEWALLSVNDILLWWVELADLYDWRLSVFLWPLSWATKFSGISASSSLDIHVLRTEWLVICFPSLWRPAFWAAVDNNFPISFFPRGDFMYQTLSFELLLCRTAK